MTSLTIEILDHTFGGALACNASSTGAAIATGKRARRRVIGCMVTVSLLCKESTRITDREKERRRM